jgi:hypothetical protein
MLLRLEKRFRTYPHPKKEPVDGSSVKNPNPNRVALQKKSHLFALAVTLLGLCMFMQAVHAKSSHYFPKTAQARYSSESVKIAKLGHPVLTAPAVLPALRGTRLLTPPQPSWISYGVELPIGKLSEQISFRLLRSPPVAL